MLPSTVEHVPNHTAEFLNRRLEEKIERRVRFFAANPTLIDQRLVELDKKWDIERFLQTNASALGFIGIVLGLDENKQWHALRGARNRP